MKITILCVGKVKEKFYRDAIDEFTKRLSRYAKLVIVEVADEKTPDQASDVEVKQIKDKEGAKLIKCLKGDEYIIALAIDGKMRDSVSFANHINQLGVNGVSHICFVIGGSLGLSDEILSMANEKISFSAMTFPHQLMRVILLEQVYRAYRIMNNEPYHK